MRIVVLTADYPPIEGGIASVTVHVARELATAGHEVTVIAPRRPGAALLDAKDPVRVVRYRGYGLGWLRCLPMLMRAGSWIRRSDLVLAMNVSSGGLIGRLARWSHGKPYVCFAYAYEFLKFRRVWPAAALLRNVYAHARAVIAISTFTRDNLIRFGVASEKVETILPGANPILDTPPRLVQSVRHKYALDDNRVILGVGRFVPRKGHMTLVRAMPRILERIPDARLVLVGQGLELPFAVREARRLGVRNHVMFPGYIPDQDLAGLYAACEVFALPTGQDGHGQVEGFGLVFSEAHAHGKPVVAGRSGGVVDAVLDGETGLIVEPNQPDALAEAIVRLMEDLALARRLGEQGRARVKSDLNWTRFTQRLLQAVEARSKDA